MRDIRLQNWPVLDNYTGSIEDRLYAYLKTVVVDTQSTDDMLFNFLRGNGYTGATSDMIYEMSQGLTRDIGLPTLALKFTGMTALPSFITFTRASSGTYRDSSGVLQTASDNEARFDHDSFGNPLGLLIEEARTNLALQSEDFGTTWVISGGASSVTVNQYTAPDGNLTADELDFDGTGNADIRQEITGTADTTYTASLYIKLISGTPSSDAAVQLYVLNNVVTTGILDIGSDIDNTWQRFDVQVTADADGGAIRFTLRCDDDLTFAVWGAQFEAGAFPTAYIATTTAAVTRSADVATMTGTNFSDWFNASEGTFLVEAAAPNVSISGSRLFTLSLGSDPADNRFDLRRDGLTVRSFAVGGGVAQWDITGGTWANAATAKAALAYNLNDAIIYLDGSVEGTPDTTVTVPTVDRIHIGTYYNGGDSFNGHISRIVYWPTRLVDTTLQAITI